MQKRARLVGEDIDLMAAFDCGTNDSKGGTVATGGERPGVAVGQNRAILRQKRRAVGSHLLAGGDIFVVHATGFGDNGGFDLGDGSIFGGQGVVEVANLLDAPEEIDRSGTSFGEGFCDDRYFFGKRLKSGCFTAVDPESHAHRGRDADGGGSADDHVANDGGDLLVIGCENVGFFEGKFRLVEEINAGGEPFKGGNHIFTSLDE